MAAQPLLYFDGMVDEQPGTPGIESLAQTTIDKCIDALCDVIAEALKSKSPNKFTEVQRLCHIGHQLVQTKATTVDDFIKIQGGQIMAPARIGDPLGPRMPVPNYGNFGVANVGLIGAGHLGAAGVYPQAVLHAYQADGNANANAGDRHQRLALEPAMQVVRELSATNAATQEATELQTLLALKDKLTDRERPIIEQRIKALVESVETRNHANTQRADEGQPQPAELPVVPADVPRGYPLGAEERQDDAGPGVRAHGERREGVVPPPEAGDEGPLLRLAMGG